ncbi:hypothetical protein FKG94_14235 [Exilibacterium tricleocarpae]|uniref:Uncharacterized protein n=1 Tax=Exilibacterium tricleocarpae TaxID=2591008 RepID=A0A545TLW8_9GAMM|nr:hypothetical protein [Exilibacterium tricleocarpae]TQV78223.1 hypothetical protein FKG94_14235 [Exilibacterium tricleocarpae]
MANTKGGDEVVQPEMSYEQAYGDVIEYGSLSEDQKSLFNNGNKLYLSAVSNYETYRIDKTEENNANAKSVAGDFLRTETDTKYTLSQLLIYAPDPEKEVNNWDFGEKKQQAIVYNKALEQLHLVIDNRYLEVKAFTFDQEDSPVPSPAIPGVPSDPPLPPENDEETVTLDFADFKKQTVELGPLDPYAEPDETEATIYVEDKKK